jgi:hypothetical protein
MMRGEAVLDEGEAAVAVEAEADGGDDDDEWQLGTVPSLALLLLPTTTATTAAAEAIQSIGPVRAAAACGMKKRRKMRQL